MKSLPLFIFVVYQAFHEPSSAQDTTTDATSETTSDTTEHRYTDDESASGSTTTVIGQGEYFITEYPFEEGGGTVSTNKPGTSVTESSTAGDPLLACGCVHQPKEKSCPTRTVPATGNALGLNHIFGGNEEEKAGDYPWMALVGYFYSKYGDTLWFCCGSLITNRHVMTAGHCVPDYDGPYKTDSYSYVIRLGEHDHSTKEDTEGTVDFGVELITIHPEYTIPQHDVAVITLDKMVEFSEVIRPLCLPPLEGIPESVPAPTFIMGWGRIGAGTTGSKILKYAEVALIPREKCLAEYWEGVTSDVICAGGNSGEAACQGDSGGPLVRLDTNSVTGEEQYTLIGVVSAGAGCGGYPGLYTNVQTHLEWILKQLK